MKTIISIIEVLIYNLCPPALAAQVLTMIQDILPLLGVAFIKIGLHLKTQLQATAKKNILPTQQAKFFKLDNIFHIGVNRIKKSRA